MSSSLPTEEVGGENKRASPSILPRNLTLAPSSGQVPANFTTRPRDSPLSVLADTLAKFFSLRDKGKASEPADAK